VSTALWMKADDDPAACFCSFHNWTGNRVTCRDWFQLTLKEGLTVFRDQVLDLQSPWPRAPFCAARRRRIVSAHG
jgi:Peptidase family M1 domain